MKKKIMHEKDLPDMPKIVLGIMKEKRIKRIDLAHALKWAPSAVTALFKRRNWETAELLMVGKFLNHDLAQYLLFTVPEGMVPASTVADTQKELTEALAHIKEQDEEILVLKTRNEVLKEVLDKK